MSKGRGIPAEGKAVLPPKNPHERGNCAEIESEKKERFKRAAFPWGESRRIGGKKTRRWTNLVGERGASREEGDTSSTIRESIPERIPAHP